MWLLPWEHDKVFLHKCKEDRKPMVPTKQLWLCLDVIISLAGSQTSEHRSVSQTNKPQGLLSTHGNWLIWAGSSLAFVTPSSFSLLSVSFTEVDTWSQPPPLFHHWELQNRTYDCLSPADPRRYISLCKGLLSPCNPCCACRPVRTPLRWPKPSWDPSSKLAGSSNLRRANHQRFTRLLGWVLHSAESVLSHPCFSCALSAWFQAHQGLSAPCSNDGSHCSSTKPSAIPKSMFPCGATTFHFLVSPSTRLLF